MRRIDVNLIKEVIKEMCISSNYNLGKDVYKRIELYKEREKSPIGKEVLKNILENAKIATNDQVPMCQDTGMVTVFIEIGQDVCIVGGNITEAINSGVKEGYIEGYLRKSIVDCPLKRNNTKDNTPAVIHYNIVDGDQVKITVAPKGFGSENMCKIKMLKPSDGIEGVEDFVIEAVKQAGPNPCPPIVVGVGIGGNFENVSLIAKKALLRNLDDKNTIIYLAEMEERLLERINKLGIGPQGLGGTTTALSVKIETYPTHIAGLPVAVAINCHASRHEERII